MEDSMKKYAGIVGLAALFFFLSCGTRSTPAREKNSSADEIPEPMKSFSFVVGTWIPDGANKGKLSEEYAFTSILGGRFLSSEEIFRDNKEEIVYRDFAVFGADPDTGHLFFHAYSTDGSIDRTKEAEASKPGAWVFLGTVYGSPQFKDYRYSITRIDDSHMKVLIELLKDGVFSKHRETLYRRKP
jgi:hypothetical protein